MKMKMMMGVIMCLMIFKHGMKLHKAQTWNREPDVRLKAAFELVHTDLPGPIEPEANEGFRLMIIQG